MVKFAIGQGVKRVEDNRLLKGTGLYTDDIQVEGVLSSYVLRSPVAHAVIKSIDTSAAKDAPGVVAVYTGEDVKADGLGDLPCVPPVTNRDGTPRADTPRPILAVGKVRHVGEPVAFVIAETAIQARDAAELIEFDFEELDATVDTEGATADGAPQLFDHIPNNIAFDWESGDKAAVDSAFDKAHKNVQVRIVNNRIVVNSMEVRPVVAEYDPETDRSTLWSSSQGPHVFQTLLAEKVLNLDPTKLRCRTTDVGGGFGMKIFLYPEQALCTWASRKLKRAVRNLPDRSEAFMTDAQGRDNISYAEAAVDADGVIQALRVKTFAALGGYLHHMGAFIPTNAGTHMLSGVYKIPHVYVNVLGVLNNTTPTDAYRGAGRPEAAYLIERVVDVVGQEMGLTPDEVRRRNFIPSEAMPYTTPLGNVYDSGEFQTLMEECMAKSDWASFEERRKEAASRGKLRGIGMGYYIEKCGGGSPETADVRFTDEGKVEIRIGTQSNGQGHETAYAQILSDTIGVEGDAIKVIQGDTDTVPPGMTGGSRSVPVGGAAVLLAGRQIVEKGKKIAANAMEAAAADIEFSDGVFTVAGTDKSMTIMDVAKAAKDAANLDEGMTPGLDDSHKRTPEAATYPNGCHIVELEVDPDTGTVEIERYTIVDDFGETINPLMLAGQVHGGIVQGVGQALTEHTVYEEGSGQLVTGSFMDYGMPRADLVPMFDFNLHNVRCTTNPLGIKGSGEAGAIGAPPAVISALVDALHETTGITHIDMPATPLVIWNLIHSAKRKAA
ncbi:xanthine dehydrogenase family protein molybdopterin-binding subunit [Thalassobaculum sp. OXR-137]|uniref:xanthine dehydrogenase family protein molybdopterin-binding subunit n=1 Tax=Thalassobaculum sp. OXR-137 TaxID=3100173 RepID=UPI002AC92CE5|nr:xanthine dehydrogenase family protein molybdopterin-binding subunit [Thalassobaculum sp. OXR-137]WPZ32501.1 xanthine dehydrogenase family protein molybdopterin-binding subunit [Thalassobaculum sp. OXR-137]